MVAACNYGGVSTNERYPWLGFERPPEGCLFEQFVDMRGPMGVAYERSLRFEKPMHTHDRLLLVFPRGGTSMRVRALGDGSQPPLPFTVTSSDGLAVPSLLRHDDHWVTEVYDTFALLPNEALTSRAAQRLGIKASVIERVVPFRRSPWLDALLVEYFEDRVLAAASAGPRHSALEELIMMEVLRLVVAVSSPTSSSRPGPSSIVARALRYLEGNLFADIDLEAVCKVAGASRSSLLRHFRREVGTTPKAYLVARRLDEGKRLLERGHHGVFEVARLIGYRNAGAFGDAFRRRFGALPSDIAQNE